MLCTQFLLNVHSSFSGSFHTIIQTIFSSNSPTTVRTMFSGSILFFGGSPPTSFFNCPPTGQTRQRFPLLFAFKVPVFNGGNFFHCPDYVLRPHFHHHPGCFCQLFPTFKTIFSGTILSPLTTVCSSRSFHIALHSDLSP